MHVIQPGQAPIAFISSVEAKSEQDLLAVDYRRVQQASSEYLSLYEGIDQHVDIKIATLIFRAAPEPLLSLYEFIMTTFVSHDSAPAAQLKPEASEGLTSHSPEPAVEEVAGRIRVLIQLASVQGISVSLGTFKAKC